MPSRYFVDIFANGRWEDDEGVSRVVFRRGKAKNLFPCGEHSDAVDLEKQKVAAKESPRKMKWFEKKGFMPGQVGIDCAMDVALIGRREHYLDCGVFESNGSRQSRKMEAKKHGDDLANYIANSVDIVFYPAHDQKTKNAALAKVVSTIFSYTNAFNFDTTLEIARFASSNINSTFKTKIDAKLYPNLADIDVQTARNIVNGICGTLEATRYRHPRLDSNSKYSLATAAMRTLANAINVLAVASSRPPMDDSRPDRERPGDYEMVFGVKPKEGRLEIWHPTKVFRAKLDMNLAGMEIRDRMMSDIGVVPRRMSRLATDGKIFERVIPELGASILIDASGSMSISSGTIQSIVKAAPASVVAMYSSMGGEFPGSRTFHQGGCIIIIAENGQACSRIDNYRLGGSNACDGIGLRWLGLQPEPRFWISDGQVNGNGENGGQFNDAAWCLRKFNINWINTNSPEKILDIVQAFLKKDADVLGTNRAA